MKKLILIMLTGFSMSAIAKTSSLMGAVAKGEMDTVKRLLKQKPNLEMTNDVGDTVLAMALGNEQDDMALILIKAGAEINVKSGEEQNPLVFLAASVNSTKALEYLVKNAPQQINQKNTKGDTSLHEAARYGTTRTLLTLIKAGAKKDVKNLEGKTPLDVAIDYKNKDAMKLLAK
ncbi:MAG: ankyrin repeat domain-containing protein [Bdellovibrionaceae bacterium]|nr:ankyrin repeat domain-containing protein [Pseudobdellovibrionaceae bacterium]